MRRERGGENVNHRAVEGGREECAFSLPDHSLAEVFIPIFYFPSSGDMMVDAASTSPPPPPNKRKRASEGKENENKGEGSSRGEEEQEEEDEKKGKKDRTRVDARRKKRKPNCDDDDDDDDDRGRCSAWDESHMPAEIASHIFGYLLAHHAFIASQVCRRWRAVLRCGRLGEPSPPLCATFPARWVMEEHPRLVLWLLSGLPGARRDRYLGLRGGALVEIASAVSPSCAIDLMRGMPSLSSSAPLPPTSCVAVARLLRHPALTPEQFLFAFRRGLHPVPPDHPDAPRLLAAACSRPSRAAEFLAALDGGDAARPLLMGNLQPKLLVASLRSKDHAGFDDSLFMWLRRVGCPWDRRVAIAAVEHGNLEALAYIRRFMIPSPAIFDSSSPLHARGNESLIKAALRSGSVPVIEHLISLSGLPLSETLPLDRADCVDDLCRIDAIHRGSIAWMLARGCPVTGALLRRICHRWDMRSMRLVGEDRLRHLRDSREDWEDALRGLLRHAGRPQFREAFETALSYGGRAHLTDRHTHRLVKHGHYHLLGWALRLGFPFGLGLYGRVIADTRGMPDAVALDVIEFLHSEAKVQPTEGCVIACLRWRRSAAVMQRVLSLAADERQYGEWAAKAAERALRSNGCAGCLDWLHARGFVSADPVAMSRAVDENAHEAVDWLARRGVPVPEASEWHRADRGDTPCPSVETVRALLVHSTPKAYLSWDFEGWLYKAMLSSASPRSADLYETDAFRNLFVAAARHPGFHLCPRLLARGSCPGGDECEQFAATFC
jgi:hypothetical protein